MLLLVAFNTSGLSWKVLRRNLSLRFSQLGPVTLSVANCFTLIPVDCR